MAITQPVITFFQDDFGLSRKKSVIFTVSIMFVSVILVIFVNNTLDEWDFWAGTIGVVIFGFIELILFMWLFDGKKAWEEINRNGFVRVPGVFYYILRYITPVFLLVVISWWSIEYLPSKFEDAPWNVWLARIWLLGLFVLLTVLVFISQKRREKQNGN